MRTTLTIDDDIAVVLKRLCETRDASLKELINEALESRTQGRGRSTEARRSLPHAIGGLGKDATIRRRQCRRRARDRRRRGFRRGARRNSPFWLGVAFAQVVLGGA